MKGISAVIATLLMLVITVALAITAYGYITGLFESQTSEIVEVAAATCDASGGRYFVVVRNLDQFSTVNTNDIIVTLDNVPLSSGITWNPATIDADGSSTATITGANATAGTVHRIQVIGPSGRPSTTSAAC